MENLKYEYYIDEYFGKYMDEDTFAALNKRAVFLLNGACMKNVLDYKKDDKFVVGCIYDGICAQIEYLFVNGGLDFLSDSGSLESASIGRFTMKNSAEIKSYLSPIAMDYMKIGGQFNRGVRI